MSEVQRYICEGDHHSAEMVPCAFGGWVTYEDYTDALATARAALEDWQRKAGEMEMRAILAEREANERGAALEDVRRVDHAMRGDDLTVHWDALSGAFFLSDNAERGADSLESLGRALAQEENHAT